MIKKVSDAVDRPDWRDRIERDWRFPESITSTAICRAFVGTPMTPRPFCGGTEAGESSSTRFIVLPTPRRS